MPLVIVDLTQSSVRGLNCSLKWGNERNPRCLLQVSGETAPDFAHERKITFKHLNVILFASRAKSGEEGEDDAKSAWPSDTLGYTRDTIAATTGCDAERLN